MHLIWGFSAAPRGANPAHFPFPTPRPPGEAFQHWGSSGEPQKREPTPRSQVVEKLWNELRHIY